MSKKVFLGLSSFLILIISIPILWLFLDLRNQVNFPLDLEGLKIFTIVSLVFAILLIHCLRKLFLKMTEEKNNSLYHKNRHETSAALLSKILIRNHNPDLIQEIIEYLISHPDKIHDVRSDLGIWAFSPSSIEKKFTEKCTEKISECHKALATEGEKLKNTKDHKEINAIILNSQKINKKIELLEKIKSELG